MYQETHETKKKILQVARKIALEKGFEVLTIRDICKESGISVGAFYHHFSSKDELIDESFLIYDLDLDSRIKEYDELNPLLSLKSLLLNQIIFVSSFPYKLIVEYYRAILASSSKGAVNKERTYYKAVDHFVELALEKRIFSNKYSKEFLNNYFIKYIRGNLIHWCLNPNIDIVNQTSSELDLIFNMFKEN